MTHTNSRGKKNKLLKQKKKKKAFQIKEAVSYMDREDHGHVSQRESKTEKSTNINNCPH